MYVVVTLLMIEMVLLSSNWEITWEIENFEITIMIFMLGYIEINLWHL